MVIEILRILPRSIVGVASVRKLSTFSTRQLVANVSRTLLLPDNKSHEAEFKKIITDERIVFTSSWIDKWFGIETLIKHKNSFATNLELAASGDKDIFIPPTILKSYQDGVSSTQLALDGFFLDKDNDKKLSEIYVAMTRMAPKTGLGYFKFEKIDGALVGGGALVPVSKGDSVERVDIALHILDQNKGIGSACLADLLDEAFEKHQEVQEVVGSSLMDHRYTPTICARQGMIIINDTAGSGKKLYFMDRAMFEATRGKSDKMKDDPTVAATYYGR